MANTHAWIVLPAVFLVSMVVTALAFATSAGAQEEVTGKNRAAQSQYKSSSDSRQSLVSQGRETRVAVKAAQTGPLAGASARIIDENSDSIVNRIVVTVSNCDIDDNATVTIEDEDGTRAAFTDENDVNMEGFQDRVVVQGTAESGNIGDVDFAGGEDRNFNTGDGTLVRSTGITCDRESDDGGDGGRDDGGVATASELVDLDCDELLQRFRNRSSGQYLTNEAFLESDVEDRIEVCLAQEVIDDTGSDDDLPDTGGLPLLGIAVLGIASVFAGASVIRGVGRGE